MRSILKTNQLQFEEDYRTLRHELIRWALDREQWICTHPCATCQGSGRRISTEAPVVSSCISCKGSGENRALRHSRFLPGKTLRLGEGYLSPRLLDALFPLLRQHSTTLHVAFNVPATTALLQTGKLQLLVPASAAEETPFALRDAKQQEHAYR